MKVRRAKSTLPGGLIPVTGNNLDAAIKLLGQSALPQLREARRRRCFRPQATHAHRKRVGRLLESRKMQEAA